jgi:anaerobic sulfite reductase subunit A
MKRLDTIFLKNGGTEDVYYRRLREKVKTIIMECGEGYENCFCASMNSNKTDDYDMGIRFNNDEVFFEVKTEEFNKYFQNQKETEYTFEFVKENKKKFSFR